MARVRQFSSLILLVLLAPFTQATGQDENTSWIDFGRDVMPILEEKCLACHGPEDAKNDFRVDDEDTMLAYVEAGDLESSSLWADYLITDDEDMKMPPPDEEQLTGVELATIKLWIEEGATWSEAPKTVETEEVAETEEEVIPASTIARLWTFQGLFHPASVHFPIALLTVSTFCLLLSFFNRDSFEPAAFHCLWIGALGGIVASLMGWAYAQYEGYGSGFSFDFANSTIDRHRWLGIAVAVLAVLLIPMARAVRKKHDLGMRLLWLFGSLCLLAGVSIVGYQGGELTYGEDHYAKEFARLFPESAETASETATSAEQAAPASDESSSAEEASASDSEASADTGGDPTSSTDAPAPSADEADDSTPTQENSDE